MNASLTKKILRKCLPPRLFSLVKYLVSRISVLRASILDSFYSPPTGYPLPPAMLRYRVHGKGDRQSFLRVGQSCAGDLKNALHSSGIAFDSFTDVLDFGCGCGRVLSYLHSPSSTQRFCGVDIDPEAIAWCQQNLPFATFKATEPNPPLPFGPEQFDFIFAISVFTHLDEEFQFAWLNELKRIVRPNAIVIATANGSFTHSNLLLQDRKTVSSKGFLFRVGATGVLKSDGLPDFYQDTYHTEKYIRSNWGKVFRICSYIERGMNSHQDLIVMQNA